MLNCENTIYDIAMVEIAMVAWLVKDINKNYDKVFQPKQAA